MARGLKMASDKVKACKSGKMGVSIQATGTMTRPVARAASFTTMETFMRENGKTTRLKVRAYTSTVMEPSTSVIGLKTGSTGMELNIGLMEPSMKDTMSTARSMELAALSGMTIRHL